MSEPINITRWTMWPSTAHNGACARCADGCMHAKFHTGPCLCFRHQRQWNQKVHFKAHKGKKRW